MSDWQTIETAPRKGELIILFVPNFSQTIHMGKWSSVVRHENGEETYRKDGWTLMGVNFMWLPKEPQPTHWMPLPEEPLDR